MIMLYWSYSVDPYRTDASLHSIPWVLLLSDSAKRYFME